MHPEMPAIPLPPEPQTVEQTGLTLGFLADLALKTLYLRGQMSMAELATAHGARSTRIAKDADERAAIWRGRGHSVS